MNIHHAVGGAAGGGLVALLAPFIQDACPHLPADQITSLAALVLVAGAVAYAAFYAWANVRAQRDPALRAALSELPAPAGPTPVVVAATPAAAASAAPAA